MAETPLVLKLLAVSGSWLLSSFTPGFFLARRLRWRPEEVLVASLGYSYLFLFLAAGAVYVTGVATEWYLALPATGLAALVACRRELAAFLRQPPVRRCLLAYGLFVLWALLALGTIRNYSGVALSGDWIEHWERTQFFLERHPLETRFLEGRYGLPARPPLMNLVACALIGPAGGGFEAFALAFLFMNSLLFVGAFALSVRLAAGRAPDAYLLLAFLALSPFVLENVTYTWTKQLAAFFVLAGLAAYLGGIELQHGARRRLGFMLLGLGVMAHYSAVVYALPVVAHRALSARARWGGWRAAAYDLAALGAPGAGWVAWSVAAYGPWLTFLSNPTAVFGSHASVGQMVDVFLTNFRGNLVPHFLLGLDPPLLAQQNALSQLKDQLNMGYLHNALLALGSVGGVLCVRELARSRARRSDLWPGLVAASLLLSPAVQPGWSPYGTANITLQPLLAAGASFLAVRCAGAGRWWRTAVSLGLIFDFLVGVFVHLMYQNVEIRPIRTAAGLVLEPAGELSGTAYGNFLLKQLAGVRFLGDHLAGASSALFVALLVGGLLLALTPLGAGPSTAGGEGPAGGTAGRRL